MPRRPSTSRSSATSSRLIIEREGWLPAQHDQREAVKAFNSMPKEELFSASAAEIAEEIKTILAQYYAQDVKALLRPDAAGSGVSIMIIMPADRYSGRVQRALQAALVRELECYARCSATTSR